MADIVSFHEKKSPIRNMEVGVESNLKRAREWYKDVAWPEGMRISVTQSGGSLGSVAKGCLTISYKGPFGSKTPLVAHSILVAQTPTTFMEELEETYRMVFEHANKWNEKEKID